MPFRNRLPLIIGVVLGLLTIGLVRIYIQQREVQLKRQLLKGQEPVPVLIAKGDIPANTMVRDNMVELQNRPALAIQPHAVMDPGAAIGQVTLAPIYAGEQVSDSKLARPDTAGALSMKTPPGKRAVTINVDSISGVGGLIKPGDYVDIMGTFALPNPTGEKATVTVTLLQRVEVLAVGQKFSTSEEGEGQAAGPSDNLTMALTPQEAQLLLFARAAQAQLQLSLRARNDTAQVADLQPTTNDTLLGVILGPKLLEMAKQAPPAAQAKKPEKKVEVFRGLQREVVALPEERHAGQE